MSESFKDNYVYTKIKNRTAFKLRKNYVIVSLYFIDGKRFAKCK